VNTPQRIVIIGFMGSGKTTVAGALGIKLDCMAVDLDELITELHGRTPNEIIVQHGEVVFRELETEVLQHVLRQGAAFVIALGGGAWTVASIRQLVAESHAFTVWLDAPFELCWARIEAAGKTRPLARSRTDAEKLYHDRLPLYELADLRLAVADGETAEEIAKKIAAAVRRLTATDPALPQL
jgi:shikimate kinase